MPVTYETYPGPYGPAFRLLRDGVLFSYEELLPGSSGYVPMAEQRAEEMGRIAAAAAENA